MEAFTSLIKTPEEAILSKSSLFKKKAYLVDKEIEADRLIAVGYGATRPLGTNDTDDGTKNRMKGYSVISHRQLRLMANKMIFYLKNNKIIK